MFSGTSFRRPAARVFGVLAAMAAITLTPVGQAGPASAAVTGPNFEIRNQQGTLCLDDYGFDVNPGAEVRQWTCLEGTNQLWAVNDIGGGWVELKNRYSNLCLDNFNFGTTPGTEVRQWPCNGATAQQWQVTDVGGGFSEIKNRHSNLCVENPSGSVADGAVVQQWTCNGSTVQRWRLSDPTVDKMTYHLERSANPTPDEIDAYARITDAMDRAIARYNRFNNTNRHLTVSYVPGVPTADATIYGNMRFGSNRGFMQEGTALHEISHTVGVGTAWNFQGKIDAQDWPAALPLLRSWDGPDARLNGGGDHMWPYGLNYANEYNELAFDRNVRLVQAMHHDGL